MDESRQEIGPSASQNKITQGDPASSHRVKVHAYDSGNLQDSDTAILDRSTLFQFKTPGNSYELRRTTERITELRDLFDELDDLIRKVKRHQAHMGTASDEKTKKMIRTSIKNVVRKLSYLSNSVSLKNKPNKVFKAELHRATSSIIEYLKNEQTSEEVLLSNLDNLRDYMDESLVTTETQITGKPPRMSSRMVRKSMMNRRTLMRQTIRRSIGTSKTKRSILTDKIKDRENTIQSFEEMRTAFESIAMAITEKSQNPTPESEGKIKTDIKKALRKLQDINAFNPDMKKVDSAFRSNLTATAELMIDYLADKDPSEEKLCDMETLMSGLLDMIEEGETALPEVDSSPKKTSTPAENVVVPSSGQSVAGSKVFKDINLPVARSVVSEIRSGMNNLLDVLKDHDYSDEKRKMSRRGVKQVLKTIKELASNARVMDALSDQLRELLAKATEQMVFYLTDEEDNIDLLRNKIQKVFVMLKADENLQEDQNIESSAETLISKESLNFNDNVAAKPSKIPVVEMAPKRSLEDILKASNSEALLAESVPSEHAGDAPTTNAKDVFPDRFHVRKIESEIKQNDISVSQPIQEPIKNRISQMEVEHPRKLSNTPLLSPEVPGPSGSIVQSNRSGNRLESIQTPSSLISQPSITSVPNVPEQFKLPGPSGSTTGISSVTVEEKVSQHTQTLMNAEPIKAPKPPVETVNTAAGTGPIDVRDQSSETEMVEKSTRATVTQIYSHSMEGSNMYSMDVDDKVSMRTKSVHWNDSGCEGQSAGNHKGTIKDIDRLRSDLELMMHVIKETNLRSLSIENRIALIQKNTSQLIRNSESLTSNFSDYRPRASNSDVAVNTIPMISAGIPGKHVIGYWARRNNEQLLIESLEDLQKNDVILGAMTQVGRKGPEEFEKHPELPPEISNQASSSMHTSCAVTGFATKRGADSGWASQLEEIPKGHKIQGVGTKTKLDNGCFVAGWLPKPEKRVSKRRKSNLKPPVELENLVRNDGIDTSPGDENEITDELKIPAIQQVETVTNNGPEPKRRRTKERRRTKSKKVK
jgi:hypothetical protein